MSELEYIQTPCVMICQLDDDDVCVGCGRTLDEIGAWTFASREEKLAILDAIDARAAKTAES